MDPNAALARLRELTADTADTRGHALELCETFDGLDEWLSRGGFLPDDWSKNRSVR